MRHNLCFACATCLLSACDTFAFDTRIQNIRIVTSHAVHSAYDTRIPYILCTVCETYENIACASNATNAQHCLFRMRNISCSSCESRMRNTLCCMRNISYARLICECLVCVCRMQCFASETHHFSHTVTTMSRMRNILVAHANYVVFSMWVSYAK